MDTFESLNLPEAILNALKVMNFTQPTPIQSQTIPLALLGQDVLGSAQTGTGKTAAYGIPLVAHLLNNPNSCGMVLVPTRELAVQVLEIFRQLLGKILAIRPTLLIGGEPIGKQFVQLRNRPRLIVGTPGRVNDHLSRGSLKLENTNFIVFDETDRMLDMGFSIQLQEIIKYLPQKRQTLMFSATMPASITKMAQSYLVNPVRISVGSTTTPIQNVQQEVLRTSEGEKYDILLDQLQQSDESFIVFVKTKMGTEKLATKLRDHGHSADAIHGDLRQRQRDQVIRGFRNRRSRILVATDIAARGLDIPHIGCVVNYDLPQCPEDYIHRIGRTGRAGAEGKAVSLVTHQDKLKWRDICRMMDPSYKEPASSYPSSAAPSSRRRVAMGAGGGGRRFGGR